MTGVATGWSFLGVSVGQIGSIAQAGGVSHAPMGLRDGRSPYQSADVNQYDAAQA